MTCQLHLAFPDPAPAEFLLIRFPYFMDLLLAGTQWGWLWGWGLCPWAALDTSGRVIWTLYDICVFDLNLVALQPRFFDWLVTLRTSCQRKRSPPGALALSRRLNRMAKPLLYRMRIPQTNFSWWVLKVCSLFLVGARAHREAAGGFRPVEARGVTWRSIDSNFCNPGPVCKYWSTRGWSLTWAKPIASEKWWLAGKLPLGKRTFQGLSQTSGLYTVYSSNLLFETRYVFIEA